MLNGLSDCARALVLRHWRENRTPVSPACRALAAELAELMPGAVVNTIPAGARALDWRIPDEWRVGSARLVAPNGIVLYDWATDNPVGLWAHSRSFHGDISRQDLAAHVSTDSKRPQARLWNWRGIYRPEWLGWGFSLPHDAWASAPQGTYRVDITADVETQGDMAWVDATLPGIDPRPILLMAHTCHPGQVADGLVNVAMLLDLYAELASRPKRYRTWRFILGPETYTAAAVLSRGVCDPQPIAGLYLDALSADAPLLWQSSFGGESEMDCALTAIMGASARIPYREIWGNDEKFWESQPWRVPVPTLARGWFPQYHTDEDTPDNQGSIVAPVKLLADIVNAIEGDYLPRMLIAGPVCRGRHGLYYDHLSQPEQNAIENAQILADGTRSLNDIAATLGVSAKFLGPYFRAYAERGLASVADRSARA